MKHIEKFENHVKTLSEEDLNYINNKFLKKIKENNLKPTTYNIYSDLELLKKDKKNSFIFWIIKDFLKIKEKPQTVQNIMHTAINFFKKVYGDILIKFKEDRKKEFDINNQKEGNFLLLPFEGELIKVPKKIGHNYIPIKILPIDELHTKYSRHKRLKTFHEKGLKCVSCPKEGKYLIATKDRGGAIHIDVYTKDFDLMTVDHIKPKSKGGSYNIKNLDPMCSKCNSKKGNKYKELEG